MLALDGWSSPNYKSIWNFIILTPFRNIYIFFYKLGAKFRELLITMNVKDGIIVPYCKTRWTTAFQSISDILKVKAVLEEVCKIIILIINFIIYIILLLHK